MISLSESLFKLVLQTQSPTFSGLVNTFTYKDYAIIKRLLELMKAPETCYDAVSSFCSILVVNSSGVSDISSQFIEVLSENQEIFTSLITSPSKILKYNALRLTLHFLQYKCEIIAKPLLLPALDILFTSPRSNVLHFLIGQIIQCILKFPTDEFPSILLLKGQLTKRILKVSKGSLISGNEHFGFMKNIAKWIMESPYGEKDAIVMTTKWNLFYQNFVIESLQKQGLLSPTIELRDLEP